MKWMLIERRPDVIYSSSGQTYLGANDAGTASSASAVTFRDKRSCRSPSADVEASLQLGRDNRCGLIYRVRF